MAKYGATADTNSGLKTANQRSAYIPPAPTPHSRPAPLPQPAPYRPFAHTTVKSAKIPDEGEWGTLPPTKSNARRENAYGAGNRPFIAGFGDTTYSSSSTARAGNTSTTDSLGNSGETSSGLRTGRKLFKPSQMPTFESAPENRPIFRSSGSSRNRPVPMAAPAAKENVFGGRERYNPLQKQMEQEAAAAARVEQDDPTGFRYGATRYLDQPLHSTYAATGSTRDTSAWDNDDQQQRAGGNGEYQPRAFPSRSFEGFPVYEPYNPQNARLAQQLRDEEPEDAWEERWKPQSRPPRQALAQRQAQGLAQGQAQAEPSRLGASMLAAPTETNTHQQRYEAAGIDHGGTSSSRVVMDMVGDGAGWRYGGSAYGEYDSDGW